MSTNALTSPRERGATALLVAMSMLFFMGIAAVVVDGGIGFSERRQAQSGVDFGALAALQFATSCSPGPCDIDVAVEKGAEEATAVVDANLPGRFVDADWDNCDDPNPLAKVSLHTKCVSFTENLDRSRVVLPDDDVPTTFGRLLGVNFLTIGAFAEAEGTFNPISNIIPLTPTGAPGGELCLFSNQAPQTVPPCDGPASGFFGYLDVALFGTEATGTPPTCARGGPLERLRINLTRGADHQMVKFPLGGDIGDAVNDHEACSNPIPNANEKVDELEVQTGSPMGPITDGLINGIPAGEIVNQRYTGAPGRAACNRPISTECETVREVSLDHTGLWTYLDLNMIPSGTSCNPAPMDHAGMLACLNDTVNPPRFNEFLGDHLRFAAVPVLWGKPQGTLGPTGPGPWQIQDFFAVWIETLYFDCNANMCGTVHSPGETNGPSWSAGKPPECPDPLNNTRNCGWSDTSGALNSNFVQGMLAFNIPVGSLHTSMQSSFPSAGGQLEYALIR